MRLLENCDHESFWRRDYNGCLNNVYELCKSVKMTENEVSFVISLFQKLWKKEVKNNQIPIIFVGQMKNLEKSYCDFREVRDNLDSYSFIQLYKIFTNASNIHNKRFATIRKDFLVSYNCQIYINYIE